MKKETKIFAIKFLEGFVFMLGVALGFLALIAIMKIAENWGYAI